MRAVSRSMGVIGLLFTLSTLADEVVSLRLINADSDTPIAEFTPLLDGVVLDLQSLPTRNLSIEALTDPSVVGSVRFAYDDNPNYQTESVAPYSISGDNGSDFHPWTPTVGPHTVSATAYTGSNGSGAPGTSYTVNFTVLDGTPLDPNGVVSGEFMQWHDVQVTFSGPSTYELGQPNPFTDYRLNVTFTHVGSSRSFVVPGYYAADGDAAETSSTGGDRWRVHFRPDATGRWTYVAAFRNGADIAISSDPSAGSPLAPDGAHGGFDIAATDKTGRDFRAYGTLDYVNARYLRFAGSGDYFLKGGADSPENFLAYDEFDGTPTNKHSYQPHASDAEPNDPTWQSGRGANILGALNYLAGKGMNSVYFLTMNVSGDGDDVWPWTSSSERLRFDCSKLDQWGRVFGHMEQLGIMLHVLTQETENDQLLDGGALGMQRTLYYRELIARFGHYLAIAWNLGEENTNTDAQRKAFATYFKTNDPYQHFVVVHTYPEQKESVYAPLLGYADLDGPSLQVASNAVVQEWIDRSAGAGHPWVVCYDEQAPANEGVIPDANDFWHDDIRKEVLWGTLMAGGAGVEYYFGYNFPDDDLDCEDWRSRDHMWTLTEYALSFFHAYLPFWKMAAHNDLTSMSGDFCFALPGDVYAIFLPSGGSVNLDLGTSGATYSVHWFDPRMGGELKTGTTKQVSGTGFKNLGLSPSSFQDDEVILVRRISFSPAEVQTLIACLSGPEIPSAGVCGDQSQADRDQDGDTDVADLRDWQANGYQVNP